MRRMKRTTTPQQFEIIVSTLKNHNDLAVGCSNTAQVKAGRKALWNRLADVLNQHGPPIRKSNEWKIIWSDYKYNLKRKLAADLKLRRKNYHRSLPFNKTERTVLCMLGLRDEYTELYGYDTNDELQDVPQPLADFSLAHNEEVSDIDFAEDNKDPKEENLISNERDLTKEVPPLTECIESLPTEAIYVDAAESDANANVFATLSKTLMSMQKTQQAILKELKESNRHKNQMLSVKERLLELEHQKFDEKKQQSYEENKQAYIKIEMKRKELELYEQKLKGLCTQCTQVKTEND